MPSLIGTPLLVLTVVLALALPLLLAFLWSRPGTHGAQPRRAATRLVGIVTAQLLAVSAIFLWVNDEYGFYNGWSDLLGTQAQNASIQSSALGLSRSGGYLRTLTVHGRLSHAKADVLVWLPPQYRQPRYAHTRFPVLMFLPGQPSSPNRVYAQFNLGQTASRSIRSGAAKPFVMVIPPLMIHPPRDTECTNFPGGPQAETWLARDVPAAVSHSLRVQPPGRAWTVMGWSTGGFCAAKIAMHQPARFPVVASAGGYYRPLGHPAGLGTARLHRNSPMWMYRHFGSRGIHMLLIVGRRDRESWKATSAMLSAAQGDPSVSYVAFPHGGHNYRNYAAYLPGALRWAAQRGAL